MSAYQNVFDLSMEDSETFWSEAATGIVWDKPWEKVLDDTNAPFYRWFTGGELNTCENAVDRHVKAGYGEQPAIIYDSPAAGEKRVYTYADLQQKTAQLAGALKACGITQGDRVIIYMSMVPEAVFAMLACARLGAVHSVVFGGFSAKELAVRIDDAKAKFMLSLLEHYLSGHNHAPHRHTL
jgi:propionyl-CoA synthetase